MRRLVLSLPLEDLERVQNEPIPKNLESAKVLHILEQDQKGFAMIYRVKLKNPSLKENMFQQSRNEKVQLLERTRDGICTYYVRAKLHKDSIYRTLGSFGGYLVEPIELEDGKVQITFIGSTYQVRKLLQRMQKIGIAYKMISLEDARFSIDSPLSKLTEKQRRVLMTAFNLGYYEVPKRTSSRELAERLGMRHSTLSIHRIKAESHLIA
jgi:predicted DNA binding protein